MANTILCLNGDCLTVNPIDNKFCPKCTHRLLLRERYQAIRLIGQGGFGRTFLAKDRGKPSKSYCVIKQFFPSAQGTNNIEKASQLFEEEAKRLEVLGKNLQIPQLLDYFVTDKGQQYLVQEYIDGENLQQELTNRGEVYRETEVREILIDVLNILKFVHENNVIHRDIKPENLIRRNSDQKLVLVDFGAAKYIHSQTSLGVTGTVIGSAQYCAAEQVRGKAVFASDLYSLGVVCIYLLTLVEPFQLFDSSENDWVWRDYLGNNQVSDQFAEVLDQLIAVGLKKRFANVDQVLKSLNDQPKKISVPTTITDVVKPTEISIPVKYQKLQKLLANGEWKAADQETDRIMLQIAGKEKVGSLDKDSINNFPCEDLRIIDQLWVKYSNSRFGFSVQKNIWLECGGKLDAETECKVGDRIGWRVNQKWLNYDQVTFSYNAPIGHLPWVINVESRLVWNIYSSADTIANLAKPTEISISTKYQKLEQYLADSKWKAADKETRRLILQLAGRKEEGSLDINSITNVPAEDLLTIDKLWVKHSKGRFGFSVQKNIWLECGGGDDYETANKIADLTGWRVNQEWLDYDESTFSLEAPVGHLPLVNNLGISQLMFLTVGCSMIDFPESDIKNNDVGCLGLIFGAIILIPGLIIYYIFRLLAFVIKQIFHHTES
jgi:serine/threonine protein kinase